MDSNRSCVSSLNLSPPNPEPLVVHGGVVVCLMRLLPSLPPLDDNPNHPHSTALQDYLAHVLKSLVRRYVNINSFFIIINLIHYFICITFSERNQQVMCEAALTGVLLEIGKVALQDEQHCIHAPLQYSLERLAAQSLEPKDLRFLFFKCLF